MITKNCATDTIKENLENKCRNEILKEIIRYITNKEQIRNVWIYEYLSHKRIHILY